jgi:Flp pilus assembly protein TadD
MRIRACSLAYGALCVLACGGSSPTPQTPAEASPAAALSSEPPASSPPQTSPPPSPDLLAGIKAFDAGNYADARKSFEAATHKSPSDYDASYNLGMACEKVGDPSCAEAAYKSALAAKPDLETAAAELCALYVDAGRFDDAIAVGRAGLAKHPSSGPLHENVGVGLASRGDQDGAVRELRAAVDGQPAQPMYRLTLAHWLNAWHSPGAVAELDQARDLAKDDYGMIASIGFEYRLAGDFAACEKMFDRAIHMKDGGEVRTQRALCKLGEKDEKATLEDLRAAVAAEPTYAPAHYYLGGRLAIAKKFKEAAAEYTKYLELAPNGSLAKAARERLKAAEGAGGKK